MGDNACTLGINVYLVTLSARCGARIRLLVLDIYYTHNFLHIRVIARRRHTDAHNTPETHRFAMLKRKRPRDWNLKYNRQRRSTCLVGFLQGGAKEGRKEAAGKSR